MEWRLKFLKIRKFQNLQQIYKNTHSQSFAANVTTKTSFHFHRGEVHLTNTCAPVYVKTVYHDQNKGKQLEISVENTKYRILSNRNREREKSASKENLSDNFPTEIFSV